jgi:phage N-6-adenine-methyltransferase
MSAAKLTKAQALTANLERWREPVYEGKVDSGITSVRQALTYYPEMLAELEKKAAAKGPVGGGPQDVRTPLWFFQFLCLEFNFIVDLAASGENTLCPFYYTKEQDSLSKDWAAYLGSGGWGYNNPEYKHALPWVRKAREECEKGARVVQLLRASSGKWFADQVYGQLCEVRRMKTRIEFPGYGNGANFDTFVVVWDGKPYRDRLWDWRAEILALNVALVPPHYNALLEYIAEQTKPKAKRANPNKETFEQ